MASVSTHVLDLVRGRPASGMRVQLARAAGAAPAEPLATAVTDADGRVADLAGGLDPGTYQLSFDLAGYFGDSFLTVVTVAFRVAEERTYHVPLLASPYASSTYLGS